MMGVRSWLAALLLCCPPGVKCKEDAEFVYSRIGGDLLLPCTGLLLTDCSVISWTFFRSRGSFNPEEIGRGLMEDGSHGAGRISMTWNCSVSLRGLQAEDAGYYACFRNRTSIITFYLSLLTITSPSTITSLQPGGQISLSCLLFTYFDAGTCKSSSTFNLTWVSGDGATLPTDDRSRLIGNTRCNITMVTNLVIEDNNRKWRCQVNTKEEDGVVFLDFTSTFVFESSVLVIPATPPGCPVHLPIPRILLCVAMTVLVVMAGVFTWRKEKNQARTPAANVQL